jgi:putative N6-adenine-specific DNA methylase
MQFLVKTLAGLEEVLAEEIRQLGGQNIQLMTRAVSFEGDKRLLYRANLELRTALRILVQIHTGRARNENGLYRLIKSIDWEKYMGVNDTLAVDAVTSSRIFNHSKYAALVTKDAIVDQFRDKYHRRPSVNLIAPKLRVNIYIFEDQCTISIDSSDDSLHKRGYRIDALDAPINEVLAAGMVLKSGWKADSAFVDPMCGSGTILIEAALYATNRAPQLTREHFGFVRWPDFDEELWNNIRQEAIERITDFPHGLYGFDKDFKAVRLSEQNAMAAGLEEVVEIKRKPFERLQAPADKGVIMINPPYDERLVKDDIGAFYEMIGDQLKQQFPGFEAWIISANFDALKRVGLRSSSRQQLFNGPLECRLVQYELYEGSEKSEA